MFGKTPGLSALESRKQLLIAESELNRAQLFDGLETLREDLRKLAHRAESVALIASSAAALVTGLAAFRRAKRAGTEPKRSWLQKFLSAAALVSNLWLAFQGKSRKEQQAGK